MPTPSHHHTQRTPRKSLTSAPASASQIFTSLSSDPLTTRCPPGEKATALTPQQCPVSVQTCQTALPSVHFQDEGCATKPLYPQWFRTNSLTSAPVAVSHIFTRPSSEPLTTRCPSGEKTLEFTAPKCPLIVSTCNTPSSQTTSKTMTCAKRPKHRHTRASTRAHQVPSRRPRSSFTTN